MSSLWAYDILEIDYGNGRFIALAGSAQGGSNVWVSLDGSNWSADAPSPAPATLTFGNNVFVGFTSDGKILTTSNGVDWVAYQTESTSLSSVDFCEGRFIVSFRSDHEYTSSDGINWSLEPSQDHSCGFPRSDNYYSYAYGKGVYVRTTWNGEIWSSADGQDWVLRQQAPPMITNEFSVTFSALRHVAFGGGMFVAVGGEGEYGGVYGDKPTKGIIYTSPDGINWSRVPIRVTDALKFAIYADGTFVAIGYRSPTILQSDPFISLSLQRNPPRLLVDGPVGAEIEIESSVIPSGNWTTVHSATLVKTPYEWTDTAGAARRFYRVVLKP